MGRIKNAMGYISDKVVDAGYSILDQLNRDDPFAKIIWEGVIVAVIAAPFYFLLLLNNKYVCISSCHLF